MKLLTWQQARWSEYLSSFDFTVRYRPGWQGGKPNALTWHSDIYPEGGEGSYALANPQNLQTIFLNGGLTTSTCATYIEHPQYFEYDVVLWATILDSDLLRIDILHAIELDELATLKLSNLKLLWSKAESGLLLFEGKVYVPDNNDIKLCILHKKHDHPTTGHQGFCKTFNLVRREYYWPLMRKFISNYCTTCNPCTRAKASQHRPYGLLKQLPIPKWPWELISLDFIVDVKTWYNLLIYILFYWNKWKSNKRGFGKVR
jgi:Integrase zinc binding domain